MRVTEQERKTVMNLADMLHGEINRMCVTDDLIELANMSRYALRNIIKLEDMRYKELKLKEKQIMR